MVSDYFQPPASPQLGELQSQKIFENSQLQDLDSTDTERKYQHWTFWSVVPPHFAEGDMYFFRAGVVGVVAGPYWYTGTEWKYMGDYPSASAGVYQDTSRSVSFTVGVDTKMLMTTPAIYQQDATPNHVAGTITVGRAGVFLIYGYVNIVNPAPNQVWSIVFYRNGAAAPITRITRIGKDNNDPVALAALVVATLNNGDVIDLRVCEHTSSQTATIQSTAFVLVQQ